MTTVADISARLTFLSVENVSSKEIVLSSRKLTTNTGFKKQLLRHSEELEGTLFALLSGSVHQLCVAAAAS